MSWGVATRNAVSLGLGGIIALATAETSSLPVLPFDVESSDNTAYTCSTVVPDSGGIVFVVESTVKDSAGTTYTPV